MTAIAMIGSSGHYGYALEGVRADEKAAVTAVAPGGEGEDTGYLAETCGEEWGSRTYDDYSALLDAEKPDIAVLCPHFHRTAALISDCFRRGIHVFAEKPVALSLDDLRRIREEYERAGVEFTAMHPYRYNPAYAAAFKAVDEGLIGVPRLITAQKSYKLGDRPDFYRRRETYGGTLPWVGSHSIDWIFRVCGDRLESVCASHTTAGNQGHDEMESAASALFMLKGGGQAFTNIDYFRPAAAATHGDDRVRIAGEKGVVEVMFDTARLITAEKEERELPAGEKGNFFLEFMQQIRGQGACRVTAEDAFRVTELCLLARESADTGRIINLH